MRARWHGKPFHDINLRKWIISLECEEPPVDYDKTKDDLLSVQIKKHRQKRSLNANALLWNCLGEIAEALRTDKWNVYLMMLKRYGKYTYICVKPNVVESVKSQWRECEEIGEININGEKAVQLLCYFGSSTYDSKEFSVLLDGVISEMKEIGLKTPSEREFDMVIESWKKSNGE